MTVSRPVRVSLLLLAAACCAVAGAAWPAAAQGHLQHYGFAVVDCRWDDPLDGELVLNYLAEVDCFTDVAQMCVFEAAETISSRVDLARARGIRPILHVQGVLFEDTASGLALRADYVERWNLFVANNAGAVTPDKVAALYLVDEPYHNGLTFDELDRAAALLESSFPAIPSLVIEAYTSLDALQVPASIDWIGFDEYGIYDPSTDPGYQQHLATLKSHRSSPGQRVVIVMDAQWRPDYFLLGWSQETMAEVAANYYTLAESDPDVIALIGYLWPGGLDLPVQLGARELPPVVQDEYVSIGRSILGPPAECPVSGVRARGNESTTLTWTAVPGRPSAVYDVERGDLGTLAETAGRIELGTLTCIENDSPDTDSTSTPDTAVPSAGDGHFYLVRWQESPELGTRGKGSSGNPRVGTGGCSAVP